MYSLFKCSIHNIRIWYLCVTSYPGDLCHFATGYVKDVEGFLVVACHYNLHAILGEVCHCDGEMLDVDPMQFWVRMTINLKRKFIP